MSIFDFQEAPKNSPATKHFWIYLAVAGPVAFACLASIVRWPSIPSWTRSRPLGKTSRRRKTLAETSPLFMSQSGLSGDQGTLREFPELFKTLPFDEHRIRKLFDVLSFPRGEVLQIRKIGGKEKIVQMTLSVGFLRSVTGTMRSKRQVLPVDTRRLTWTCVSLAVVFQFLHEGLDTIDNLEQACGHKSHDDFQELTNDAVIADVAGKELIDPEINVKINGKG